MKGSKWKYVFRFLVDGVFCPALLLIFMLTAWVVLLAQPTVFKMLYSPSMKDRPELIQDGLKIAEGLSTNKRYAKINMSLSKGRIGSKEIVHYEDIRQRISLARGFALVSFLGLLMLGVACASKWYFVMRMALAWFLSAAFIATIWGMVNFRHFFRTLHWWVFQDDSWILPDNCYSLQLYPYKIWQAAGMVMMGGMLVLLLIGVIFIRPKMNR